ncbi:hypothetical protein J4207_06575 [Candidatus Woesearchaeota archaeon]|nr:hypothetical protein [Candidatus Woesearchaeota archaeon]
MTQQMIVNESQFKQLEKDLLSQVMDVSKAMIETFKFKLIYGTKITEEQNTKTLRALQDFRSKSWNKNVSRNEAYKQYLNMD